MSMIEGEMVLGSDTSHLNRLYKNGKQGSGESEVEKQTMTHLNSRPKRIAEVDGSESGESTNTQEEMKIIKRVKRENSDSLVELNSTMYNGLVSPGSSISKHNRSAVSVAKHQPSSTGHRPVTSCTHCRQHKIKCNASENFPASCSRCKRMGLQCQIDPQFRPKKGSQLQNLKNEIEELNSKLEFLLRSEGILASAMRNSELGRQILQAIKTQDSAQHSGISVQTYLASEPELLKSDSSFTSRVTSPMGPASNGTDYTKGSGSVPPLLNDSAPPNSSAKSLPPGLQLVLKHHSSANHSPADTPTSNGTPAMTPETNKKPVVMTTNTLPLLPSPQANIDEFVLGDVQITIKRAEELHTIFVTKYLPYFPIMTSESVTELYSRSQLLFWTVMLIACLSDPEPTLYNKLASLIKQLAIETCWIRTPRSTHISQALLLLCNWPLPNLKVLDDCSYRFVGLAKSLSFQLGLHRGEFMSEFTRTQALMPDAEKWRTRTWLGIFFAEQCWSSILGLPSTFQTDYIIEKARLGKVPDLPMPFRQLICLAHFQAKLSGIMGSSVSSQDGLLETGERAGSLAIMEWELSRLHASMKFDTYPFVEIYYLYAKLMICCFAFLPDTPIDYQKKYVTEAYMAATRIITLLTKILEERQLIELPIYVRHSANYAALILFKIHLTLYLPDKYVDSARQSIVTLHRLYRNQLSAWAASVENDISRTASVLEKLNFVLITHPELFVEEDGIISRMRSHLTGTLFYDLVYCVHEARRRENDEKYNAEVQRKRNELLSSCSEEKKVLLSRKLFPLPFYNQISKEDFETITQTTPNGTTVTKLVPTKNAMKQARMLQSQGGEDGMPIKSINGIPLSMLDATGSVVPEASTGTCKKILQEATQRQQQSFMLIPTAAKPATDPLSPSSQTDSRVFEMQPADSNSIVATSMQRSVSASLVESSPFGRNGIPKITSESIATGIPNSLFNNGDTGLSTIDPRDQKSSRLNSTSAVAAFSESAMNKTLATTPSYTNLSMFLDTNGNRLSATSASAACDENNALLTVGNEQQQLQNSSANFNQLSELDTFFLQQSTGWIEGNSSTDDFLGWYDINMIPEF
ncbi:HHL135Cp [Eremothecium sinecaudum]|uniref:HHL135Cp n=1 Tax=Eremothecium sinecaudum TaxID=45286 RepID=A0A120K2U8_9SACH|nr:HHL135Cp [Eremothecium sinecaudum]AMD22635.1 HHL135Cp [Eremothecium sinecaudum]